MTSETQPRRKTSRRDLLVGAGTLALVAGGWQLWIQRTRDLVFTPIDHLPGWKIAQTEGFSAPGGSASTAIFLGIGESDAAPEPFAPDDLSFALYSFRFHGRARLAVFSDFFCPFCRVLTKWLAERASNRKNKLDVVWHELPLLGPSSVVAAKAAVAASLQRRYPAFQGALLASPFRPSKAFLRDTGLKAGLDPEKLLRDMESDTVAARLERSRRAAETLGIYGTPALTIGRTLVIGQISEGQLDALIADERRRTA